MPRLGKALLLFASQWNTSPEAFVQRSPDVWHTGDAPEWRERSLGNKDMFLPLFFKKKCWISLLCPHARIARLQLWAQWSINKHDHKSSLGCFPFMSEYVWTVKQPERLEWKKTKARREECFESEALGLDLLNFLCEINPRCCTCWSSFARDCVWTGLA